MKFPRSSHRYESVRDERADLRIRLRDLAASRVHYGYRRPGKPTDNAYIESFNGRVRQECLNEHWFIDLEDAQEKLEEWRLDYNRHRPHSALGHATPEEFAARSLAAKVRSAHLCSR